MRPINILFSILLFFILFSCATQKDYIQEDIPTDGTPMWMTTPPQQENTLFGVGIGYTLEEAKQRAIINIGQQINTQINTTLEETSTLNQDELISVTSQLEEAITHELVIGGKYIDNYLDGNGLHWVLAGSPSDCLLDVTESLLLSYELSTSSIVDTSQSIFNSIEFNALEHYLNSLKDIAQWTEENQLSSLDNNETAIDTDPPYAKWSLDTGLLYIYSDSEESGTFSYPGLSLGTSYRLTPRVALGLSGILIYGTTEQSDGSEFSSFIPGGYINTIIGNKSDGLALNLVAGQPSGVGLYYKDIYANFLMIIGGGAGAQVGYSF